MVALKLMRFVVHFVSVQTQIDQYIDLARTQINTTIAK